VFFAGDPTIPAVFVAEFAQGHLGGFLECGPGGFTEGCCTSPVGYIEGWWVDPQRVVCYGKLLQSARRRAQ